MMRLVRLVGVSAVTVGAALLVCLPAGAARPITTCTDVLTAQDGPMREPLN